MVVEVVNIHAHAKIHQAMLKEEDLGKVFFTCILQIYEVGERVTPFWHLSFLPLFDALYLQFNLCLLTVSFSLKDEVLRLPM